MTVHYLAYCIFVPESPIKTYMSELIGNTKTTDPGQQKGDVEADNIPSFQNKNVRRLRNLTRQAVRSGTIQKIQLFFFFQTT